MKSGIVCDIKGSYVTVLTSSGEFLKLNRNKKTCIGEFYSGKIYRNYKKYCIAASIVLALVTGFSGYSAYAHQIIGSVDVYGDGSVKLYYNRKGVVEKVNGLSTDKNIKNKSINTAIKNAEIQCEKDSTANKNNGNQKNAPADKNKQKNNSSNMKPAENNTADKKSNNNENKKNSSSDKKTDNKGTVNNKATDDSSKNVPAQNSNDSDKKIKNNNSKSGSNSNSSVTSAVKTVLRKKE